MIISSVTGHFEDFNTSVEKDNDNFTDAYFNFTTNIDSINTNNNYRDAHLKSDDFFNASEYPRMSFKSKSLDFVIKYCYSVYQ